MSPYWFFFPLQLSILLNQTHVAVEDDGPHESEDDGRPSVYDVRDVYVDQFNLVKHNRNISNKVETESPRFAVFRKDLQTFS